METEIKRCFNKCTAPDATSKWTKDQSLNAGNFTGLCRTLKRGLRAFLSLSTSLTLLPIQCFLMFLVGHRDKANCLMFTESSRGVTKADIQSRVQHVKLWNLAETSRDETCAQGERVTDAPCVGTVVEWKGTCPLIFVMLIATSVKKCPPSYYSFEYGSWWSMEFCGAAAEFAVVRGTAGWSLPYLSTIHWHLHEGARPNHIKILSCAWGGKSCGWARRALFKSIAFRMLSCSPFRVEPSFKAIIGSRYIIQATMDFESRFELSTRDRQIFVHHRDLPRGPNLDTSNSAGKSANAASSWRVVLHFCLA